MSSGAKFFLDKLLGQDFMKSLDSNLSKSEIYHPNTRTVSDISDIKDGLQIVPRAIMAFLIKELAPMEMNDHKELDLPIEGGGKISVNKVDRNAYTGFLEHDNKKMVDFISRTIPSLGIVIMSTFELYDVDQLFDKKKDKSQDEMTAKVQQMIDERLNLHSIVSQIVDKKLLERDSIKQLIHAKINDSILSEKKPKDTVSIAVPITEDGMIKKEDKPKKKGSPLKEFLEDRSKKPKKNEHIIEMVKSEQINCPDCGHGIFDGHAFSSCICYGDNGKVFLKKTENGLKIRFGKNWDVDSIEMLLEVLRGKKNE